jgi:hypothetical protein
MPRIETAARKPDAPKKPRKPIWRLIVGMLLLAGTSNSIRHPPVPEPGLTPEQNKAILIGYGVTLLLLMVAGFVLVLSYLFSLWAPAPPDEGGNDRNRSGDA